MANITEAKRKSKANQDFPLWLHPSGRWCRKIRGQWHYFGRDRDAALEEWRRVKDDLLAGHPRPPKGDGGLTIADLCNHFLTAKRHLVDTRELSPRTWQSYFASCAKLVGALGKHRQVSSLTASDFEVLRTTLAKGRGLVTLRGDVLNIRTAFKYGYDNGLVSNPIRYGQGFKIPDKAALRRSRQDADNRHGKRLFEADELRRIIKAAPQPLRAMVLLGINCAFGATDISSLPESTMDLSGGWVTFPRPKTAVERRCALWPETVVALREVLKDRREPKAVEDAGLVFLTRCRVRWVRFVEREKTQKTGVIEKKGIVIDAAAAEFAKVLKELGIKRRRLGFYALRHTFRTEADRVGDEPAVDRVMGHADGSMAEAYRERIEDERLKRVADRVRSWLFGPGNSVVAAQMTEPATESTEGNRPG